MDCRVKPGNDGLKVAPAVTYLPSKHFKPPLGSGSPGMK
jgi:hypothetical protein